MIKKTNAWELFAFAILLIFLVSSCVPGGGVSVQRNETVSDNATTNESEVQPTNEQIWINPLIQEQFQTQEKIKVIVLLTRNDEDLLREIINSLNASEFELQNLELHSADFFIGRVTRSGFQRLQSYANVLALYSVPEVFLGGSGDVYVDPEILSQLETQSEVLVSVTLKDMSNISINASAPQEERRVQGKVRNRINQVMQDQFISELNDSEFKVDAASLFAGRGFDGWMTKKGFEKLMTDPRVKGIGTYQLLEPHDDSPDSLSSSLDNGID